MLFCRALVFLLGLRLISSSLTGVEVIPVPSVFHTTAYPVEWLQCFNVTHHSPNTEYTRRVTVTFVDATVKSVAVAEATTSSSLDTRASFTTQSATWEVFSIAQSTICNLPVVNKFGGVCLQKRGSGKILYASSNCKKGSGPHSVTNTTVFSVATCDDNLICTDNKALKTGECLFSLLPGFCLIENTCIEQGFHPNECQYCDVAVGTNEWTNTVDTACDDGDPCTTGDVCTQGHCIGKSISCDDSIPCTEDTCEEGHCEHTLEADNCLIGNLCYPDTVVNPKNFCQHCDVALNWEAWSSRDGTACDDGNQCTQKDTCINGACEGSPYDCNDYLDCTTDLCLGEGTCSFYVTDGYVVTSNKCFAYAQENPENSCQIASPNSETHWTNKSNSVPCNDKDMCTVEDACVDGICIGQVKDCSDSLFLVDTCLPDGTCNSAVTSPYGLIEGECLKDGSVNPENSCQYLNISLSSIEWSNQLDNTPCDDGSFCTLEDSCESGMCAGTPNDCNDFLDCTEDSCKEEVCRHIITDGRGLINGICVNDGDENPLNFCQVFVSSSSQTNWSNKPDNISCDDGIGCTKNDICLSGSCVGIGYSCDDSLDCTSDVCENDACKNELIAGFGLISGTCFPEGYINPDNACQVRDYSLSFQSTLVVRGPKPEHHKMEQ
ncbi:Fibronectin type III domain protein [Pelomyxa schiedti]|nr:Fibronectin type III domain protein [Pelomyxa schiedti]